MIIGHKTDLSVTIWNFFFDLDYKQSQVINFSSVIMMKQNLSSYTIELKFKDRFVSLIQRIKHVLFDC